MGGVCTSTTGARSGLAVGVSTASAARTSLNFRYFRSSSIARPSRATRSHAGTASPFGGSALRNSCAMPFTFMKLPVASKVLAAGSSTEARAASGPSCDAISTTSDTRLSTASDSASASMSVPRPTTACTWPALMACSRSLSEPTLALLATATAPARLGFWSTLRRISSPFHGPFADR